MSGHLDRIQHVTGTPFEVGHALGRGLGPRLEANIVRYVRERVPEGAALDVARWRAGALPWLGTLPARFQQEFEGLARGAGLPLQRLAEWAYLEVALSAACSGAIVELGGDAWVARNNDIFCPDMWGYVTIREVTGRIPAISFGLEGDVFTPTGINQERLWLHYNYAPAWDAPEPGRPCLPGYVFLVEALETCRTLEDVEALLGQIQRDDGMLLFAVEGATGRYCLYECTCRDFHRREAADGFLVATNHYRAHPAAPPAGGPGSPTTVSRCARLETLVRALLSHEMGGSPVEDLIRILADDGVEARQGESVTAYATVACPARGELWYTFGGYPAASRGNWQRLAWPW